MSTEHKSMSAMQIALLILAMSLAMYVIKSIDGSKVVTAPNPPIFPMMLIDPHMTAEDLHSVANNLYGAAGMQCRFIGRHEAFFGDKHKGICQSLDKYPIDPSGLQTARYFAVRSAKLCMIMMKSWPPEGKDLAAPKLDSAASETAVRYCEKKYFIDVDNPDYRHASL